MNRGDWASDTQPSMPISVNSDVVRAEVGAGFAFTPTGIKHDLNATQLEEMLIPMMSPEGVIPGTELMS